MYQYQLKQTAFREFMENERQEWLAVGMTEADVFSIHFGTESENGRGGDYGMWLSERKHCRADHKYAPGVPVAIDSVESDCERTCICESATDGVDFQIDLEAALETLTDLQRRCFVEVVMNGRTQQSVADELNVTQQMVDKHIRTAKTKLQNYFRT
jgi:RNA polymerase sigma factor (sigma-70 family)